MMTELHRGGQGTPLTEPILVEDDLLIPTVMHHGDAWFSVLNGYIVVVTFLGCRVIDFAAYLG